jgi:hypothetical protein
LNGQLIYEPGQLGRQENEPSCGVNPLNELHILCAYNWYGFSDLPNEHGDAWIAISETTDGGRHWIRRPLTGTKLNYPVGKEFAADPTVLVFPGGAMVTSIAGNRSGNSVMLVQRMIELNRESGFRYVSEAGQIVVDSLEGSHFIDKPDSQIIPAPNGGFGQVTMTLEEKDPQTGQNLVVTRQWPNFRLVVTFADFNASGQNIRTWSKESDNFGLSFSNKTQISNTSGLDQGLSVENKGNDLLYVWRRFDSGEGHSSIVAALSNDSGSRIGKAFEITDICEFDQFTAPSAQNPNRASVRTNDFPWLSATGSHWVLVYTERPRSSGNCLANYTGNAGSRIMIRTSSNGKNWSNPTPVTPFEVGPVHFQFMPNVACARGACVVTYYSTLTESAAYEALLGSGPWQANPFIEDFTANDPNLGLLRFRRSVDVFASKITIAGNGTPMPSAPERVSRYQIDFDEEGEEYEREWNPLNVRNYGGNTVPFIGDYIGLGVPEWRRNATTNQWEDNNSPIGSIADAVNRTSYFAAWTDNRRVRGLLYDDSFAPLPYEVPAESGFASNDDADSAIDAAAQSPDEILAAEQLRITEPGAPAAYIGNEARMAETRPDRFLSAYTLTAEGVEDPNPGAMTCSPSTGPTHFSGEYQTRIKDSEIYGAIIEDRVRVSSPTVAKNLGSIQRGFVIGVENIDPELEKSITLVIGNQPGAPTTSRASWRQLPFAPPFDPQDPPTLEQTVTIEPLSTEYVTLFVVSPVPNAPVTVFAFDGTTMVSQITVNGQSEAGGLIDPGTTGDSVLLKEIHDPNLIEPIWDEIQINALNPNFRNPNFRNPNFRNLNTKNTDYMDPNLRNPDEQNPNFRNETEAAPNLRNPNLRNPNLRNEGFVDSFIDVTYTVTSNNNTTTAVNADFAYGGSELNGLDVQVIAWEADELDSLQDCETGLITESKVISSRLLSPDESNPNLRNPNLRNLAPADIADPFQGTVSFPLAPNGAVNVTIRIFCVNDNLPGGCLDLTAPNANGETKLEQFLGYNFWAQKANTGKDELTTDNEVITKDVIPPEFNVENGHMFRAEALDRDGAYVDITAGTNTEGGESISADDNGAAALVSCALNLPGSPTMPGPAGGPALVPVGTTGVTCTAQDTAIPPNVGTWTGTIRVEDRTPPVLALPASPLTLSPTSAAGAIVDYVATATDAIDPDVTVDCTPPSGSLFPIGNTLVTCTATDDGPNEFGAGNEVQGTFTVAIVDVVPPVVNGGIALSDIYFEATAMSTPVILPEPTVEDLADPDPVVTNNVGGLNPSLPLGETLVTWTVTDFAGNSATATQKVIVRDTTAPVMTVPANISETATSPSGKTVTFSVTATDVFPVTISCVPASGATFPVGNTTVACTATDTSGNSASGSFVVSITFAYGTTGIRIDKPNPKTGTSIPTFFAWTVNGVPQNVGAGNQIMTVRQGTLTPQGTCPATALAQTPGSSGFQLKADNSWQWNFQAVDDNGNPLPATGSGTPYCLTVTLTSPLVPGGQSQSGVVVLRP